MTNTNVNRPGETGNPDRINIMNNIKIENIRRATVNGRAVKIFTAYRAVEGGYVHIGQFSAPARTANKDLVNHIPE